MCRGITGAEVGTDDAPCWGATGKGPGAFVEVEEEDARDPGGPLLEGTGVCGKAPIEGAPLMAFRVGGFSIESLREDVGCRPQVAAAEVAEVVRASSEAQAQRKAQRSSLISILVWSMLAARVGVQPRLVAFCWESRNLEAKNPRRLL